jgi:hydrogenase/urease accessory protein HupE
MKRIITAVALAASTTAAWAHPGVHHLNGVGHSVTGSDTWLAVAAIGVWAIAQFVIVRVWLRRRAAQKKPR